MDNLLFLFLGLILAYLLEFTRPWAKSYFEKSSLTIKERRIYLLVTYYWQIKNYKENPAYLNLLIFRRLIFGVIFTILFVGLVGVLVPSLIVEYIDKPSRGNFVFSLTFFVILLYTCILIVGRTVRLLNNLIEFDKFKERTIAKLIKLGGNPENLDKEGEG